MRSKINIGFLAVILMAIVGVSGCTIPFYQPEEPKTVAGNEGLRIESFGPDVEFPVPNQSINIEVIVKNVGDAVAKNVKASPYLLAWSDYTGEKTCASSLNPPNPEINREGEECKVKWSVTTPSNIKEPQTYDVGVSVTYEYETNTLITVYALSEERYVKKELQQLISQLSMPTISAIERFVESFMESLNNDQRVFFDYTFAKMMQNWRIWKEKENRFTANRLLACTQGFCLFNEDLLKSKIPQAVLSTKQYWTLKDLIPLKFSGISLRGCSANSMEDLDQKLTSNLNKQRQPEKCLRILLILRNYSSHNIRGGTNVNCFYDRYEEILLELVRAMCYIHLAS